MEDVLNRAIMVLFFGMLAIVSFINPVKASDVNGILHGNVEWSGDIHILGDVIVDSDAILNIVPGTTVRFAANQNANPLQAWDTDHSWIIVRGCLIAEGTENSRITFTSDASSKFPNDWACIFFENMSGDSSLKYCTIEYGVDQINTTGANSNHSLIIQNCIIRHAEDVGILLGLTGNPNIQYNTIYGNGEGVGFHESMDVQKNATIQNNIFTNNENGIVNSTNFSYTTAYNDVWNNNTSYGQYPGVINHDLDISVDPLYVDLANDNVRLNSSSPCLHASSNNGEIGAYGNSAQIKTITNNPGLNILLLD
jgi:hypothetical protein